ncbi:MAG: hypothetical protein LC687_05715 [Actinobacteria bacterium]|nr:hypothetical protein [Actinomycetota bacterium]
MPTLTLRRIHYAADGHVVSDELFSNLPQSSRIVQLFTQRAAATDNVKLNRAAFLRDDGEEIVWERYTTT